MARQCRVTNCKFRYQCGVRSEDAGTGIYLHSLKVGRRVAPSANGVYDENVERKNIFETLKE